jgi:hypothetical protein
MDMRSEMWNMRTLYGLSKGKRPLTRLGVDGRTILKCILK